MINELWHHLLDLILFLILLAFLIAVLIGWAIALWIIQDETKSLFTHTKENADGYR